MVVLHSTHTSSRSQKTQLSEIANLQLPDFYLSGLFVPFYVGIGYYVVIVENPIAGQKG